MICLSIYLSIYLQSIGSGRILLGRCKRIDGRWVVDWSGVEFGGVGVLLDRTGFASGRAVAVERAVEWLE